MASDDYFVVVYKLLSYYYTIMKKGIPVRQEEIDAIKLGINQPYLLDVYRNMLSEGYLTGTTVETDGTGISYLDDINNVRITTKGVEYIVENSIMKKIGNTLSQLKTWLPYII